MNHSSFKEIIIIIIRFSNNLYLIQHLRCELKSLCVDLLYFENQLPVDQRHLIDVLYLNASFLPWLAHINLLTDYDYG